MESVAYVDFESASKHVMTFLHERLGFGLWMVTRTEGDDWIALQTEDHGYNVKAGSVFRWADSFCSQMVKGKGPRIAPISENVPAYAAAPIAKKVPIKAYIGMPLMNSDGGLFGTLCAIDPATQPASIVKEERLIEILANLLSTTLQFELKAAEQARRSEKAEVESLVDSLTQLYNRRGWDRLMAAEEERCRRHGHPACVAIIDLNEMKQVNDTLGHAAGDEYLVKASSALRTAARTTDVVARLGGDEFGVLTIECKPSSGHVVEQRLKTALEDAGVKASVGIAFRDPSSGGLQRAWESADEAMYEDKKHYGAVHGIIPG
jgi:diguanylate cyclase